MIVLERMRAIDWIRRLAGPALIPGTACAALLTLVVSEAASPAVSDGDVAASEAAASSQADAPTLPIVTLPPLESMSEVVARPVFSPSRRPSAETGAEGSSGEVQDLVLEGIVVAAPDRIALIRLGSPAKTIRAKEGQTIDGWTVRSISPDRILLENAGTTHELRLGGKSRQGAG